MTAHASTRAARATLLALTLGVAFTARAQDVSPPPPPPPVSPAPADAPAAPAVERYVGPRELEKTGQLVPYEGGQIPVGAQLISKPRGGLLTGGLVVAGVSYIPWLLVDIVAMTTVARQLGAGLAVFAGLVLAIPVLGPGLTGISALASPPAGSADPTTGVVLLVDALLQGVGIALIATAYGSPERFVLQPAAAPPPRASWMILPGLQGVTGPSAGARLAMQF